MFENWKKDYAWRNTIKIALICYLGVFLNFCFLFFSVLIIKIMSNQSIDKNVYIICFLFFYSTFISYSLSVFILNSSKNQQQKYQFLWLFLFILALNLFGIVGILMLINQQKQEQAKNIVVEVEEKPIMVEPEKWFFFWALYSSIGMMLLIITIPLSIINLVKIKKNWRKKLIDVKKLKKIAYFSSDIILMFISNFAF